MSLNKEIQPKIQEEWKLSAKNHIKKLGKDILKMRVNTIQMKVSPLLNNNFKISNDLIRQTLDSINQQINDWTGVDMKSSVQRKENNERKTKKKQKNESWYKSTAKSWFNQRVYNDDFFGKFWYNVCLSIKESCKEDKVLFYKCLHTLLQSKLEFGKSTKAQPLLQASIMNKSKKMHTFLKDNKICNVERIKDIHYQRFRKKIGAKKLRLEIIVCLNKLIQNPNCDTMEMTDIEFKNDLNNSVRITHAMPFNNISRKYRYNPMDAQYNPQSIIEDRGNNNELIRLQNENNMLKSENNNLKLEIIQWKNKHDTIVQQYYSEIKRNQPPPPPPSMNDNIMHNNSPFSLFNDDKKDMLNGLPPVVTLNENRHRLNNHNVINFTELPPTIINTTSNRDNISVSTNSTNSINESQEIKQDERDDYFYRDNIPEFIPSQNRNMFGNFWSK